MTRAELACPAISRPAAPEQQNKPSDCHQQKAANHPCELSDPPQDIPIVRIWHDGKVCCCRSVRCKGKGPCHQQASSSSRTTLPPTANHPCEFLTLLKIVRIWHEQGLLLHTGALIVTQPQAAHMWQNEGPPGPQRQGSETEIAIQSSANCCAAMQMSGAALGSKGELHVRSGESVILSEKAREELLPEPLTACLPF